MWCLCLQPKQNHTHLCGSSQTHSSFLYKSDASVMDNVLFELFSASSVSLCGCNNLLMVSLELLRNVPFQFEHKRWFDYSPAHRRRPIRALLCSLKPPLPHPHLSAFKPLLEIPLTFNRASLF